MPNAKLTAISANGSVVWGAADEQGFVKWTAASTSTATAIAGYYFVMSATNNDGTVAVGHAMQSGGGWYRTWLYADGDIRFLDGKAGGGDNYGFAVSDDGRRVAGMSNRTPVVWLDGQVTDIAEYLQDNNATAPSMGLYAQAITPDGKIVAGGSDGGEVVIVRLP
jgi:hypothetical protein